MKKLILSLALAAFLTTPSFSQETATVPTTTITGTVVVKGKSKLPSSAIVNDKIWWEGDTFLVKGGKVLYRFAPSKNVKLRDGEELMKLVKVENGKLTFEFRGKTVVRSIKKRTTR